MRSKIDSIDLSYYLINSGKFNDLSHLKLQKLLYYIQAWHIVFFDGDKLIDDDFEAWIHGPVSRKIYNQFKDESILHKELEQNNKYDVDLSSLAKEQQELIDDVLDEYGDKSAYHLECLTHDEKPWIEARGGCQDYERCSNIINNDTVRSYYESLIA